MAKIHDKYLELENSVKNKLDSLFFARLFVSEQKQIAFTTDENLRFSSHLRNKLLRNEDYHGKKDRF